MNIPSPCCIAKSEIMLEEGMANRITTACFHLALCSECVDVMMWKLGLSLPASYIGCTMYHERICSCHFGILPSWVQGHHSPKISYQLGSVTEYHHWIKSWFSYAHSPHREL